MLWAAALNRLQRQLLKFRSNNATGDEIEINQLHSFLKSLKKMDIKPEQRRRNRIAIQNLGRIYKRFGDYFLILCAAALSQTVLYKLNVGSDCLLLEKWWENEKEKGLPQNLLSFAGHGIKIIDGMFVSRF